ncbi:hypothetical protein GF406_09320, partial [candidate division KSB1 bacterium]|nr:hypothetical protein [candidate division KSB1 bacterium]
MKSRQIKHYYCKYFESIGFERLGLFECLQREFGERRVLYLGSFIHITPSFVFRNVTYLDRSELARDFFSDLTTVTDFIEQKKTYRSAPKVTYIE